MENLLKFVGVLNECRGEITLRDGDAVYTETIPATKETPAVTKRYVIKLRPVSDKDGIESFQYVARLNK